MKQINANFKLKEPNSSAPTLIFLKSYFNKQRLTYSTGIRISPQYWDERSQRPITDRLIEMKNELKINSTPEIRSEKKTFEELIRQGLKENPVFKTDMNNITTLLNRYKDELAKAYQYLIMQEEPTTPDSVKARLDKVFNRTPFIKPRKNEFYEQLDEFLESRKQVNSPLTIKKYQTLKTRLLEFEKKTRYKINFQSIDLIFYDKFRNFLLQMDNKRTEGVTGYLNDTIAKYFSAIKSFMQWAMDRNYHSNTYFQHKRFEAKKKAKNEIVSLTEDELMKLYHLKLNQQPKLEKVRDVFCFATFTGQRWSDIETFKKEDIKGDVWEFMSYKTKKMMEIPFKGFIRPALDILIKYNYDLPLISQQRFNDYIKDVGKLAGINETVVIKRFSGKELVEIKKPKYAFMSSHMARRTCITILLQKGVPPTTVMKLSGHTDLKTLMKYENTSQDALVEALEKT